MPRYASLIAAIALIAAPLSLVSGTAAFEESKYPDWSGQWRKPANPSGSAGNPWDQTKPSGRAQGATHAEYHAILEASLADQQNGRQGENTRIACIPPGMPRLMTVVFPMEVIVFSAVTYILFDEEAFPRRIYTDGCD